MINHSRRLPALTNKCIDLLMPSLSYDNMHIFVQLLIKIQIEGVAQNNLWVYKYTDTISI